MYKASADTQLPTSIIGSLPRPSWFTENLGTRSFLEAMVDTTYREQYEDTISAYLQAQNDAGIDICTDGDAHYDKQVAGPVGPGDLQYSAMWRAAQRMSDKPIKFGTITPELLAASVEDDYYSDPVERTMALSQALNHELNVLANAGCQCIQIEEPQIHMTPARGKLFGKLGTE